jgi:hypothetical protein
VRCSPSHQPKPDFWDVRDFLADLEVLGKRAQLSFFDLRSVDERALSAKAGLNPMLPILARSVFESGTIKASVKLPLAIRLEDAAMVGCLLSQQIARDKCALITDARLLVYAAYHDLGSIVDNLLDGGFDAAALDQLIVAEVERELARAEQTRRRPRLAHARGGGAKHALRNLRHGAHSHGSSTPCVDDDAPNVNGIPDWCA